ncbi:MAG: hypothetical protein ACTSVV_04960 [Promethearchaeota archaeon]
MKPLESEGKDGMDITQKLILIEDLEKTYNDKINELNEKIKTYEINAEESLRKKEEFEHLITEFEKKSELLENKKKEYESKINSLEEKREKLEQTIQSFENRKRELEKKNDELEKARKHFLEMMKNLEEKKTQLEILEYKLKQEKENLEFQKYELKKKSVGPKQQEKIKNFSKEITGIKKHIKKTLRVKEITNKLTEPKVNEMESISQLSKLEKLKKIFEDLIKDGNFESCLLIDNKGMLIAEYSKKELDSMAIGAMFSLISTSVYRAITSLKLHNLKYFKLASGNGEFLFKTIELENYDRNFILIVFYEKSELGMRNLGENINRKLIRSILKIMKKEFKRYMKNSKSLDAFKLLDEKLNILKEKYKMLSTDIAIIRKNLLDDASMKIKEIFN